MLKILQQDLYHLSKWELEWDMEFNPGMCVITVVIHVTRSRAPIQSQYLLNGQVLESVAGSKYLNCCSLKVNVFVFPVNGKGLHWI